MAFWRTRPAPPPPPPPSAASVAEPALPVRPVTGPALSPRTVWRTGLILLAVAATGAFGWFVISDAGSALFTIVMAWFAAITMEPAIRRLESRVSRGTAVMLVMLGVALFLVVFGLAFGRLFVDQIAELLRSLPALLQQLIDWVNRTFSTQYSAADVQAALRLTPEEAGQHADDVLRGFVSLMGAVFRLFLSAFTAVFLIYYFAADAPRLRLWIARLLPTRWQRVFLTVWDLTIVKTGGYVSARVVLATINASTTGLVFLLIGMPYWLALALWTGLVAQF